MTDSADTSVTPLSDGDYPDGCQNPSRHKFETWEGWTIGSYVHARLPSHACHDFPWDEQCWEDCPVFLVDIWKDAIGAVQFVVAHLYTRNIAGQRLRALGEWMGMVSLVVWPYMSKYVLSNHFETVYEWQLRTWTRSTPPSVALPWIFNTRTNRLTRFAFSSRTDIGRALDFKQIFPHFLQLPRELRDCVYENALLDERQPTNRSCLYTRSMLRNRDSERSRPSRDLCTPALGPLPRFQTPGILRVSKQIQHEALETIYTKKTLVVTITSAKERSDVFKQKRLPRICQFSHVRFDLVLFRVTSETLRRCLLDFLRLLRAHVPKLRSLEIRICHSHLDQATETSERALLAMLTEARKPSFTARDFTNISRTAEDMSDIVRDRDTLPDVIAGSMRELALVCRNQEREKNTSLQVSWGVSEEQKRAGDYSCQCTYLSATYLHRLWSCIYSNNDDMCRDLVLLEETCQHMGCTLHRC
jgi:hypothetical protein